MKITLVSFYFLNPGIRYISSYLKKNGYDVSIVFLVPERMYDVDCLYSEKLLANLVEKCRDSSVIGLSVLTNDYYRAVQVTKYLQGKTGARIFWGGIHTTMFPENAPREADYVYIGEGEKGFLEAVEELGKGRDISNLDNLAYWRDGTFHKNKLRPFLRDEELDHYQDFDYENHYINDRNDTFIPVTSEITKNNFSIDFEYKVRTYLTIFTRGCPHGCTYCCNNKLNSLYKFEKNIYRRKPVSSIIKELKYIVSKFPFVKYILFEDDNFLVAGIDEIREFADRYKREIDLPFTIYGSPVFINEEKLKILCDAGLREVHIGVQSGSARLHREVYKRHISVESVVKAGTLINKLGLRGRYDFIFDNPYETVQDQIETAKLIMRLPKPYIFQSFSLTFFPGTEMYDVAKKDGKLCDERYQIYGKKTNDFYLGDVPYLKLVCFLMPRIPPRVGKVLISKPMVFLFHRDCFKWSYGIIYRLLQVIKNAFGLGVDRFYGKRTPQKIKKQG